MSLFDFDADELDRAIRSRWGKPSDEPTEPTEPANTDPSELADPDTEPVTDPVTGDTEPVTEPTEPTEPATEPVTPEPTPVTSATDEIDLGNGVKVTREQALAYYQFEQRLQQDPNLMPYIQAYGRPPVTQPTTPATPPVELDLDDPGIKYLVERQAELERQLTQLNQVAIQTQGIVTTDKEAQMRAFTERAVTSFQAQNSLTDTEMEKVRTAAGNMNVIDTWLNYGRHPITNEPVANDPLAAIECALNIALSAMPDVQDRVRNQAAQKQLDNKQRKQNLQKVGGTGGSSPRTPPAIDHNDKVGLRAAFINDVRGIMNGTANE